MNTYYGKSKFGQIMRSYKGQIISEQNCGVLNFPEMQQNIARISGLAT